MSDINSNNKFNKDNLSKRIIIQSNMNERKTALIAPNSFKGCADSVHIGNLFNKYLSSQITLILKPLSDGGDGFIEVCNFYYGGERLFYEISSPYSDDKFNCEILYNKESRKVFIESAKIVGLKNIPEPERKPLKINTKGLGDLLALLAKDVENNKLGISEVIIGVGGTGTIDFGLGACSRLGLKLLDTGGNEIEPLPVNYSSIESFGFGYPTLPFSLVCITDVNNPLTGEFGAARVFGTQKGASETEIKIIDLGLENLVNILKNNRLINSNKVLNGAGGGIAAGLEIFLNAKIIPAVDFISDLFKDTSFSEIDFLITGEGAFDIQSINQKVTGIVIDLFYRTNKTIFLVCGKFDPAVSLEIPRNVRIIEISRFFKNENQSISNTEDGIRLACGVILEHIKN